MRRKGAEGFGVARGLHHRPIPAAALPENTAIIARGERAVMRVDVGHELIDKVILVFSEGRRIKVLRPTENRPVVGRHDDRGLHLAGRDQPVAYRCNSKRAARSQPRSTPLAQA